MNLFFDQSINKNTKTVNFSFEESKHIKSFRMKSNELITVTNGKGLEWIGELEIINKNNPIANKISSKVHAGMISKIEIAIAPTKKIDRIEWLLEKSTEIGVKKIHFIQTKNSIRKKINKERLEKIIISSMKQSKQFHKPIIYDMISFNDFIILNNDTQKFIAHCQNTHKTDLAKNLINNNSCTIMIGPEGDFTRKEVDFATLNGFNPVGLGKNRLRTETAALVAIQTVHTLLAIKK